MITWPDLKLPPLNLWNMPRLWTAEQLMQQK
jgi:hypothetical protein